MDETKGMRELRRRIGEIKRELLSLGDLRPGSISQQYNVCGTPGCQCKASPPKRHGPYYQLGWTRKGKSTTRFVRPELLSEVREETDNYERLQKLVDRWIELSIDLCDTKLKRARKTTSPGLARGRRT
jgi:hypothetical protein